MSRSHTGGISRFFHKVPVTFKRLQKNDRFKSFIKITAVALTLIPFVILVITVLKFAVNVPFWDEWNFMPLIGKSFEEGITFEDLWMLHNEHRLLFPRSIMLLTVHAADYNVIYEMLLSVALAACSFLIILAQIRKSSKNGKDIQPLFIIPVISLLVFSLHQGENWVMGCQIQVFLNLLASVAGFSLLTRIPFKRIHLLASILAGLVATYSFASGLLFWLIGIFALLINAPNKKKKKYIHLSVWLVATLFVFQNYFYNFHRDPALKSTFIFLKYPLEYIKYILKYLGAVIINYQEYALIIGLLGILFFIAINIYFLKKGINDYRKILPFVLMGLYAIGSGMVTGIGRVAIGSEQAMAYRYVTISNLFWISNLCIAFIYLKVRDEKRGRKVQKWNPKPLVHIVIIIFVLLTVRTSYRVGYSVLKKHHEMLIPAQRELLRCEDDKILERLYIDTEYIKEGVKILKKYNLSVFRDEKTP